MIVMIFFERVFHDVAISAMIGSAADDLVHNRQKVTPFRNEVLLLRKKAPGSARGYPARLSYRRVPFFGGALPWFGVEMVCVCGMEFLIVQNFDLVG